MNKKEFVKIRHELKKSQTQIAHLLGISAKAVQSFEQGWRNIPSHTERQLMFLLALKKKNHKKLMPCWVLRQCPVETRDNCPTWEFKAAQLCWFINGTICNGKIQKNWKKKMSMCRKCEIFQKSVSF